MSSTDGCLVGGGVTGIWSSSECIAFIEKLLFLCNVGMTLVWHWNSSWLPSYSSHYPFFLLCGPWSMYWSIWSNPFLASMSRPFILLLYFITLVHKHLATLSSSMLLLFQNVIQQCVRDQNHAIMVFSQHGQIHSNKYSASRHFHIISLFPFLWHNENEFLVCPYMGERF